MTLAMQIDDLVPEAQEALFAEIQTREIQPPDILEYATEQENLEPKNTLELPDVPEEYLRVGLQSGTRYVIFQYCFSLAILSFKRSSSIQCIKPGESVLLRGLKYSLISFLFGWWGFPWGPIWTISTIIRNLTGGLDVTNEVSRLVGKDAVSPSPPRNSKFQEGEAVRVRPGVGHSPYAGKIKTRRWDHKKQEYYYIIEGKSTWYFEHEIESIN